MLTKKLRITQEDEDEDEILQVVADVEVDIQETGPRDENAENDAKFIKNNKKRQYTRSKLRSKPLDENDSNSNIGIPISVKEAEAATEQKDLQNLSNVREVSHNKRILATSVDDGKRKNFRPNNKNQRKLVPWTQEQK